MVDEKQSEVPKQYYNYKFACPTFDMTGECKHFPGPIRTDRCQCCKRPKGTDPGTECNFTVEEF